MAFGYQYATLLCKNIQLPSNVSIALSGSDLLVKVGQTTMLTLTQGGNMTVPGTLTATGAQTFTGAATFGAAGTALTVTNNALISGTLEVTGAQTLTGVTTFTTSPIFTLSAPPRLVMNITDEDAQNAKHEQDRADHQIMLKADHAGTLPFTSS